MVLEFAAVGEEGSYRSYWRMKHQQGHGSERVNEEPNSHTSRNTSRQRKLRLGDVSMSYAISRQRLTGLAKRDRPL